jgi:hypothetical protein
MRLTIKKLEELLGSRNIIINKIFTIENLAVYIEVLCLSNADIFLLYIPSKYDIHVDDRTDIYKISYIEIDQLTNEVPKDYGEELDNNQLEMTYNEIELDTKLSKDKDNIAGILEEKYKRPISLTNITKKDKKDLQDIYRQLDRLKFCVQSIKYKLGIVYKNYFVCIRRDDTIDCYLIKHFLGKSVYSMMVIVDLETFYTNINSIEVDVNTVQDGIYKILDKNQDSHTRTFKNLLQSEKNIASNIDSLFVKKTEYTAYLQHLDTLLKSTNQTERKILEDMAVAKERYANQEQTMNADIEKSHVMNKFNRDLEKISNVKQDIIKNIIDIRSKREDIFLMSDKFLFDNIVMINALFSNINKLIQYTK